MKARIVTGLLLLCCFCASAVHAQTPNPPPATTADLDAIRKSIDDLRSEVGQLDQQVKVLANSANAAAQKDESSATAIRLWVGVLATPIVTALGLFFVYQQLKSSRTQAEASTQQAHTSAENLRLATAAAKEATAQATAQQNWKKSEFLANQVRDFFADKVVTYVVQMLDFSVRAMTIEKYGAEKIYFMHDKQTATDEAEKRKRVGENPIPGDKVVVLAEALRDHNDNGVERFTPLEALVRDDFDWFFFRLEQFHHMIQSNLFTYSELEVHLRYVLDLISGGRDYVSKTLVGQIEVYAKTYDFQGTEALIKKRKEARPLGGSRPTTAMMPGG